ncbi:hypothetical protein DQ354_00760 [Arthrobacter sp. AQ5-06]|nr:hypothetical protein DQ354_00760 [Arthrobacter sp. AQ5-06]
MDRVFGKLTGVPLVSSLGADSQPVAAVWEAAQCSPALARPGVPPHFGSFREDERYLDDVLPRDIIARGWRAHQNYACGRPT